MMPAQDAAIKLMATIDEIARNTNRTRQEVLAEAIGELIKQQAASPSVTEQEKE